MAQLHKKVITLLRHRFVDVVDALEDVPSTGRITGVIVSPSFEDLDYEERQEQLWSALDAGLTAEEARQVGPIAVLIPAEANVKVT